MFEGDFVDNVAVGEGTYSWPDGSAYAGGVRRGLRHGRGIQTFASSSTTYDGEWRDGMRHGRGVLTHDSNVGERYDGEWACDQKSGQGTFAYASGDVYVGQWAKDLKNGVGKMEWKKDGEWYNGEWLDGKPHGYGVHAWRAPWIKEDDPSAWFNTANKYEGEFQNGLRHGRGVFQYATGTRYDGEWKDNVKHGKGTYTFEDGSVFKGTFEKDRAVVEKGGAPFEPTKNLKLDVEDLMDEEQETVKKVTFQLDHLFLRHNSELRGVYRVAAVAAARDEGHNVNPNKAVPLTVPGFIALLRRAGITTADVTVAVVSRAILPAWAKDKPRRKAPEPVS